MKKEDTMTENSLGPKIYSAGFAGTISGKNKEANDEFVLFHEKEPEGIVGASNLYVLTDGVSGTWHPEIAANFAAKKIIYSFFKSHDFVDANKLALAIRESGNEIYAFSKAQQEIMAVGVVTAAVTEGKLVIGSVGDGRVYIVRNGKVFQIIEEQSILEEKVRKGEITREQAFTTAAEDITAVPAIGTEKDTVIDIYDGIDVKPSDILLLCSHGLTAYIGKKEILDAAQAETPKEIVNHILETVSRNEIKADASVIAIRIYDEESIQNVVRNEGVVPALPDLNKDIRSQDIRRKAKSRQPQPGVKKTGMDKLPFYVIGGLLCALIAVGVYWFITSGRAGIPVSDPNVTATMTIDPVQGTLSAIRQTADGNQFAAFASTATVPTEPTALPIVPTVPAFIDIDGAGPTETETGIENSSVPSAEPLGTVTGSEVVQAAAVLTETTVPAAVAATSTEVSPAGTATISPEPTMTPIPATPVPEEKAPIVSEIDSAEMVFVSGGNFLLGASAEFSVGQEDSPQVEVYLDPFWIDKTEVTNERYLACAEAGKCTESAYMTLRNVNYANYPVTYVTVQQAADYCAWAGKRLPTEAEWEKAARGTDGRMYPWGSEEPTNENQLANIPYYSDPESGLSAGLFPVGSFPEGESPYGALDMAGNVWEWTASYYDIAYYQRLQEQIEADGDVVENPPGAESGIAPVIRGGSAAETEINNYLYYTRTTNRGYVNMSSSYYIGFRCVMTDTP